MKRAVFFAALLFCHLAGAQGVLVPYRVGNKFGLSDLKGNLVLQPQYDYINYICKNYFEFGNYIRYMDTVRWVGGRTEIREEKKISSGVLYKNTVLISGQAHSDYHVELHKYIIGTEKSHSRENCMFYNMNGKKLFKENLKDFKFFDEAGTSMLHKGMYRYRSMLISHYDKSTSFCVYDIDKQIISAWVLDHVTHFKPERDHSSEHSLVCTYSDAGGNYQERQIGYNPVKGRYEAVDRNAKHPAARSGHGYGGDIETDRPAYGDDVVALTGKQTEGVDKVRPVEPKKFKQINDSLITCGDSAIHMRPNARYFFFHQKYFLQSHPLIYEVNHKRGLIISDTSELPAIYDSLAYIDWSRSKYYYYAGVKDPINHAWRFGILDSLGRVIVPLVYDSLLNYLPQLDYQYNDKPKKNAFTVKVPSNHSDQRAGIVENKINGLLLAYRNGTCGLITLDNKEILASDYDVVYNNGFWFFNPLKSDFYILKKGDKYGVLNLNYKKEITTFIAPVFTKIPTYYYRDYYDTDQPEIFGLGDEESLFFCLANKNGLVYYRGK